MYEQTCPWCGSIRIDAEYVDIGVGFQRVTPFHCADCYAHEFYGWEDRESASPEERAVGWWRGFDPNDHAGDTAASAMGHAA